MTSDQILLMFFGIPIAVLGMGLRRSIGTRGALLLVPLCVALTGYALGLEWIGRLLGAALPIPLRGGSGPVRAFGPFCLAAILLGAYGAAMTRLRKPKEE